MIVPSCSYVPMPETSCATAKQGSRREATGQPLECMRWQGDAAAWRLNCSDGVAAAALQRQRRGQLLMPGAAAEGSIHGRGAYSARQAPRSSAVVPKHTQRARKE